MNYFPVVRRSREWAIQQATDSGQFILDHGRIHSQHTHFFTDQWKEQRQPLIPQRIKPMRYNRFEPPEEYKW